MKIQRYTTTTLLQQLRDTVKEYQQYNLLLCGGNTPYNFYTLLAQNKFNFPKNSILTDDRVSKNNSNEIMLNQTGILTVLKNNSNYTQIQKYKLSGRNARRVNNILKKDYKKNNVCLLGMGLDGHIAGIMPNSNALDSNKLFIHAKHQDEQKQRLTITKKFLVERVDKVILIITEQKYNTFENFYEDQNSPTNILQKVTNLSVAVLKTS